MMSRATKLEDVFLLNPLRPEHFTGFEALRHYIKREYCRLRQRFPCNETLPATLVHDRVDEAPLPASDKFIDA